MLGESQSGRTGTPLRRWRGRMSGSGRIGRWYLRLPFQNFGHQDNGQRRDDGGTDEALGQAIFQDQASRDGGKGKFGEIHGWAASTGATV